jgi:hypothetical protein
VKMSEGNQYPSDKVWGKSMNHWFPSYFVTWSCWLREIIIDFPQTLSRGQIDYGKLSLISLKLCHLGIEATKSEGNQWLFPKTNMTTWQILRKISDNFP